MRVLIMNDSLIGGGTEMQGIREKKILQEKGHDVILLTFDKNFPRGDKFYNEDNGFYNIPLEKSLITMGINSLVFSKKLFNQINNIIDKFKPDIVHANNLYSATCTQYKAISKIKNIQTVRDYAAVCPLATCIKSDISVCNGSKFNNCYTQCGNSIKNICKIFINNRNNKLRKTYINKFICPSEKLTEYSSIHGYNISCVNNPFDFDKISNMSKNVDFQIKKYLYYGEIKDDKGIMELIEAFIEFSKDKDTELIIAGKIRDDVKDRFYDFLKQCNNIKYLGYLDYENMLKALANIHTIVVPSKWMENYPNTVLEGQATSTLVIGSDRGGIPSMLSDGKGFTFDITDKESIVRCLEKSYNLTEEEYSEIVSKSKDYVLNNNSFDRYYLNIIDNFK